MVRCLWKKLLEKLASRTYIQENLMSLTYVPLSDLVLFWSDLEDHGYLGFDRLSSFTIMSDFLIVTLMKMFCF